MLDRLVRGWRLHRGRLGFARRPDVPAGSVWRQVKLGSESIYEVIGSDQDLVDVLVVAAPGLPRGAQLRLARAAVAEMERIDVAERS